MNNVNNSREKILGVPNTLDSKYVNLVTEVVQNISNIMSDNVYFTWIYGSYPNWMATEKSDIDIVIGTDKYDNHLYKKLSKMITEFHCDNFLWIDNEVPLKNKLLIEFLDFHNSSNLKGFDVDKTWNIIIPDIVKDKEFLSSEKLKLRLLFFILTSPIIKSWNCLEELTKYQNNAIEKLFLMALKLKKNDIFTINDLLNSLFISQSWNKGELFLWYKENYLLTVDFLLNILQEKITSYILMGYISECSPWIYIINKEFNINEFINE